MNEEQLKQALRNLGKMAGQNLSEDQLNQMVGNILGGTQRAPVSASFNFQNIADIAQQIGQFLGIYKQQEQLQPLIQQQQQAIAQLGSERERIREALERKREATVGLAREELSTYQKQILDQLGMAMGIGSGQIELADTLLRRARMEVENLAAQYDTAIAQTDWEMASQIEQRMASLLENISKFTQQNISNLATALSTAFQFPYYQQQYLQNHLNLVQQVYQPILENIIQTGADITPQTSRVLESYASSLANALGIRDANWIENFTSSLKDVLKNYKGMFTQLFSLPGDDSVRIIGITKQGQFVIRDVPTPQSSYLEDVNLGVDIVLQPLIGNAPTK